MSSPHRGTSPDMRQLSSKRKVVTVPSWARNLPPEFPDDEYDHPSTSTSSSRPLSGAAARHRSLSSLFHPPQTTAAPTAAAGATDANSDASTSSPRLSSPDDRAPLKPRPPPLSFQTNDVQRQAPVSPHGPGDKWWTFTLPSKYLDKVHDYVQHSNAAADAAGDKGKERDKGAPGTPDDDKRSRRGKDPEKEAQHKHMTMTARLAAPTVFSMNQPITPGWSSPWQPFHRNSADNHDPFQFLPDPAQAGPPTRYQRLQNFALNNAFAPLVFRFGNLALTVCTLGLASHIRKQEARSDLIGVIGSSTLFAICVCPLAIVHVFANIYIEYFGRPIGLWQIRTKMFHTLTELIFIALFSSLLSLAFDDLFNSPLECTPYTPYARFSLPPVVAGSAGVEGTLADKVCNQQIALIAFTFSSMALYIAVLVVSLFRIFVRVKR